jgi:hypothetical protein
MAAGRASRCLAAWRRIDRHPAAAYTIGHAGYHDPIGIPADATAIEAVTVAAFATAPHAAHTEQFIVAALRRAGALSHSLVAESVARSSVTWRCRRSALRRVRGLVRARADLGAGRSIRVEALDRG